MMNKKVLIVSTSLRNGSNSDLLAEEFAKGAQAAGHSVEKISLVGKTVNFCKGCLACQMTHRCVIQDDAAKITEKMASADVLVFATPVYYYEMSGQMKTVLDRANPLYDTEYSFREVYLLATAAEDEDSAMDGAIHGLNGWLACFPETSLKGVVRGTGLNEPGEAAGSQALKEAYTMAMTV